MMADNFKELFLQYNKPWLRENLQEMLTPRTIFAKRSIIIEQLRKILGPIEPNISGEEQQNNSESKDTVKSTSDDEIIKKKNIARNKRLVKKFGEGGIKMYAHVAEGKVTQATRMILSYWVIRMRMIRKLRVYVQEIMEQNIG